MHANERHPYTCIYRIAGNFGGQNIRGCCLHLQIKVVKVAFVRG